MWADVETITAQSPYEYTITGLTPGETYSIVVVAENIHGFGAESEIFVAMAAQQPEKPAAIVTAEDYTDFILTWTPPFDNYLPITYYDTEILSNSDGTYQTVCIG